MAISIPKAELVDVNSLKLDGQNPNRMTPRQLERLKSSIEKYGFIVPIITNMHACWSVSIAIGVLSSLLETLLYYFGSWRDK